MTEIQPTLPESLRGPNLPLALLRRYAILVTLVVLALVVAVTWFLGAFDDQGYAPEQPIAYSHKQHAGDLHIPCLYCHFNAERGKHAGIPPMSVCMGCHGQGQGGILADKPEIQKLQAIVDQGSYTDPEGVLHVGGVVHWHRVHKLPDHVYFSHQWHVKAGVACQTCHGPIETMSVVRQYATLSMGWCLDCHRGTRYIGGPNYHKDDPASFTVGTANYNVTRERQADDPHVTFIPRELAGKDGAPVPTPKTRPPPGPGWITDSMTMDEILTRLVAEHPTLAGLPRWRLVDLPESHRKAYQALYDADPSHQTFMNAPTQCSTCHQ